jgi:hypothetical protein
MKRRILIVAALPAFLTGCQTAAQAPMTASGKPEVTIKASAAAIKAKLLSLAMVETFQIAAKLSSVCSVFSPSG